MPANHDLTAFDRVGRGPARHLARELVTLTGTRRALVLLTDLTDGTELARHVEGRCPGGIDGDAILALVLPSRPSVCEVNRLHEPSLRRLAHHWRASRLLLAPCTFGHHLVGLAVVALGPDVEALPVEHAARPLAERFAASVVGTRLLAHASDGDSLPFSIGA